MFQVKNMLKYLRRTKDMFLVYGGLDGELDVKCYIDIGFQTDRENTRSQSSYVLVMNRGVVAWRSSKQSLISLSSTEVECIAWKLLSTMTINRGLIQAIPTSLPPQPIREELASHRTNHSILKKHRNSFRGGPTDSVVEHISNVLEIASIFNAQESTLVQVFPLTLEGIAKRWFEITSTKCRKSWSDLKQNFIRRFYPPAMIFKQLSEIRNFKQEDEESLFDTWERYNDLLFKCPFHDLNDHSDSSHKQQFKPKPDHSQKKAQTGTTSRNSTEAVVEGRQAAFRKQVGQNLDET
ncbi:hypothetical protein Tco_0960333 [Tanacetum coccineum]